MNKDRKAKIDEVVKTLETLRDEEQEAFDNLPESLQGSEKGQAMSTAIEAIDNAVSELENIE